MRAIELYELGDRPAEFSVNYSEDDVLEAGAPDIGLSLYLTRGLSHRLKRETVFIEFSVNGKYSITGTGNAIIVFSTVKKILESTLSKFLVNSDIFVEFGSESSETSRISLYRKITPFISKILGNDWVYRGERTPGGSNLLIFSWARKSRQLDEENVQSSWITDIEYNRPNETVTLHLSSGRYYSIIGVPEEVYQQWLSASSKGQFFHRFIKDKYNIEII